MEHSFIQNAENALDDFIVQGRVVLDDPVDQRNALNGSKKRLIDTANTLGVGRDVIGRIGRRRFPSLALSAVVGADTWDSARRELYIPIAGAIFTCLLILEHLGQVPHTFHHVDTSDRGEIRIRAVFHILVAFPPPD